MEKIKIAYFVISEVRAGVEEHILDLMLHLDRRRFEISLICPPKLAAAFQDDFKAFPFHVHGIKVRGWRDLKSLFGLYHLFRQEKFDIIHSHMFRSSFICTPVAKLAGIPVVIETDHGREAWRKGIIKGSYFIDRIIARLTNKIIAVSEACGKYLLDEKGLSAEKVIVIQNGRDLSIYSPDIPVEISPLKKELGIQDGCTIFGVVGRLEVQKGHIYLLEAIPKIMKTSKKFKILIVGDGSLREELESKAKELGIKDHLIFTGFRSDIPKLLRVIDIFVLPSLFEGLPLVAIEASATGKPVIATAVDGTPEVIIDGKTGILVPPRDPESLSKAMLSFLYNPSQCMFLGQNGRDYVNQKYSIQRQIRETEQVYYSCLELSKRC